MIVDSNTPYTRLTAREVEILSWTAGGRNSLEIAELLHLSPETIRTRIKVICKKLGARNKTQATVRAIQLKLLDVKIHPNG